jgi:hypothetical protein
MATEINRICPHCGSKLVYDTYKYPNRKSEHIAYCDNDKCPVKPCTDSSTASNVYADILAITGDKE